MKASSTIKLIHAVLMFIGISSLRPPNVRQHSDDRGADLRLLANTIFLALAFVCVIVFIVLVASDDTAFFLQSLDICVTYLMGFMKILSMFVYRKELKQLVDLLVFAEYSEHMPMVADVVVATNQGTTETTSIKLSKVIHDTKCYLYRVLGIFVLLYAPNIYATGFLYLLRPVILTVLYPDTSYRLLPQPIWLPFDNTNIWIYLIKYFIQCAACTVSMSAYVGLDALFALLMGHIAQQLKIVAFILSNLEELASETSECGARRGRLWEQRSHDILANCVAHYVQLREICSRLNVMFAPFFIVQALCTSIMMSLCLFMVASAEDTLSADSIMNMVYYAASVFQLLIYCTVCQTVTDESERLRTSVSDAWWKHGRRHRANTLMLHTALLRPIQINILGSINLNYIFFTSVLKTSFSYFTLLRTVTDK